MNKNGASYGANIIGAIFTAIQPNEILQIVSLVLTILATCFSLAFTIYNWHKKANEDGKITAEEWRELGELTKDDIEKLKEIKKKNE